MAAQVGDRLVHPKVQGSDGDGPARGGLHHRPVGGQLLLLVGHAGVSQEQVFRTVQPDPAGSDLRGQGGIVRAVDVREQLDTRSVHRDRLLVAISGQPVPPLGLRLLQPSVGGLHLEVWVDMHLPLVGVQGNHVARADLVQDAW